MKMKKRVSMWLIVLLMVCSLMGCSKEKELTPEDVYVAAYEKIYSVPVRRILYEMYIDYNRPTGRGGGSVRPRKNEAC